MREELLDAAGGFYVHSISCDGGQCSVKTTMPEGWLEAIGPSEQFDYCPKCRGEHDAPPSRFPSIWTCNDTPYEVDYDARMSEDWVESCVAKDHPGFRPVWGYSADSEPRHERPWARRAAVRATR